MRTLDDFAEVVLCDFEYHHGGLLDGPPVPVCACALELRSGRKFRLWQDQLASSAPPWAHGSETLFVSYNACAELGCYLRLGWPLPPFILDLLIEHRQLVNGVLDKHHGRDLLSAMRFYGLSGIEAIEKEGWQNLILTGGQFTPGQQDGILDYCWSDIAASRVLLREMLLKRPRDLDPALFRGRYTIPASLCMQNGIPIDTTTWSQILDQREDIQRGVAAGCPCYEGTTFKLDRFAKLLHSLGLLDSWSRTDTGRLSIDDECFRKRAYHPEIEKLRQIRQVIDQLSKPSFHVLGGRNYYSILPFKAETSRNATIGCIFQAPSWLRGLIQPTPGQALAYVDFAQEEFFIAGYRFKSRNESRNDVEREGVLRRFVSKVEKK